MKLLMRNKHFTLLKGEICLFVSAVILWQHKIHTGAESGRVNDSSEKDVRRSLKLEGSKNHAFAKERRHPRQA